LCGAHDLASFAVDAISIDVIYYVAVGIEVGAIIGTFPNANKASYTFIIISFHLVFRMAMKIVSL
jgi:hypothetical protein